MRAPIATDIFESHLSRWLFTDCPARSLVWRELSLPFPATIRFELKPPNVVTKLGPGDVDVLVFNPSYADLASVFECKRIKVKPEAFETLQPGKLRDLKKGALQANGLFQMGFNRTYLLVSVVIDGRERHNCNFIQRGLSGPLVKTVYDFLKTLELRPEVGLAVTEIVQTVDEPIESTGSVGFKVVRPAIKQLQSSITSEWVRAHIEK